MPAAGLQRAREPVVLGDDYVVGAALVDAVQPGAAGRAGDRVRKQPPAACSLSASHRPSSRWSAALTQA